MPYQESLDLNSEVELIQNPEQAKLHLRKMART